jgi:hypothetical protein
VDPFFPRPVSPNSGYAAGSAVCTDSRDRSATPEILNTHSNLRHCIQLGGLRNEAGNERVSYPDGDARYREKVAKLVGSNLLARVANAKKCDSCA